MPPVYNALVAGNGRVQVGVGQVHPRSRSIKLGTTTVACAARAGASGGGPDRPSACEPAKEHWWGASYRPRRVQCVRDAAMPARDAKMACDGVRQRTARTK